jgi:hypothetical protein
LVGLIPLISHSWRLNSQLIHLLFREQSAKRFQR